MTLVDTPTGRIHVESHGKGPSLVIVPSFGCTTKAYRGFLPHLTQTHRVLLYDPTGMGRSDDHQGELTARTMAEQVVCVMDHFGAPKASLMGASMGAFIAQHVALTFRDRLDRLILVTPPTHRGLYAETINQMLEDLITHCSPEQFLRYLINLSLSPAFVDGHPRLVRQLAHRLSLGPREIEAMKRQIRGLRGGDMIKLMAGMDAPTLIIAGGVDVITPPDQARALHSAMPHSELMILDHVAHNPFIEATRVCFSAIRAFLTKA